MKRTIQLALLNETKGAVRFIEVGKDGEKVDTTMAVVGTLYVRKSALNGEIPKGATVTLDLK